SLTDWTMLLASTAMPGSGGSSHSSKRLQSGNIRESSASESPNCPKSERMLLAAAVSAAGAVSARLFEVAVLKERRLAGAEVADRLAGRPGSQWGSWKRCGREVAAR